MIRAKRTGQILVTVRIKRDAAQESRSVAYIVWSTGIGIFSIVIFDLDKDGEMLKLAGCGWILFKYGFSFSYEITPVKGAPECL